jgi:hypothetical protein
MTARPPMRRARNETVMAAMTASTKDRQADDPGR